MEVEQGYRGDVRPEGKAQGVGIGFVDRGNRILGPGRHGAGEDDRDQERRARECFHDDLRMPITIRKALPDVNADRGRATPQKLS